MNLQHSLVWQCVGQDLHKNATKQKKIAEATKAFTFAGIVQVSYKLKQTWLWHQRHSERKLSALVNHLVEHVLHVQKADDKCPDGSSVSRHTVHPCNAV